VVGFRFARCHDFVADAFGKRDVNEAVAMDVPEFAPFEPKFQTSIAMRLDTNAFPSTDGFADSALRSMDWHSPSLVGKYPGALAIRFNSFWPMLAHKSAGITDSPGFKPNRMLVPQLTQPVCRPKRKRT
jgi:hypothetical protein